MKKSLLFLIVAISLLALNGCQKDSVRDESGFDHDSKIVEQTAYDARGQEYIKMTYLYDGNGRLARYRHYVWGSYTETLYDYQDKKRTERGFNLSGPTYVRETFYIDDKLEYRDKVYYYNSKENYEDGKYSTETTYEYNSDMRQSYIKSTHLKRNFTDIDWIEEYKNYKYEDLSRTYEYFYDDVKERVITEAYLDKSHDKLTRYYSEDISGSLIEDYRYTYDEYGKVTSYWRKTRSYEINEYHDYEYSKGSCTYTWSVTHEGSTEPVATFTVVEKYE